jgi:uncharacterized protein involved in exopolysaccharide biosynthesis
MGADLDFGKTGGGWKVTHAARRATQEEDDSIQRGSSVPTEIQQPAAHSLQTGRGSLPPIVRLALKRRRLIEVATLVIVALALALALLLPPRYVATAVILPPQEESSAGAAMMAQLGGLGAMTGMGAGALGLKNPNDMQVALLKSRTVEDAMVERFHLQALYHSKYPSSARKSWEAKTSAESGLKDGLIRLTVTDHDARRAAQLANGWVEQYKRFTATLAVGRASQKRLFFQQQLSSARQDLANAEEQMKQTEQRTGVIELDGQASAMISSAAMLRAQVEAKQVEIRAMRQFAADGNPDLERAQQELSSLEGQLSAMDVGNNRATGDLVVPKGTASEAGLEYSNALREVQYRAGVVKLLAQQYEMARVDEAQQGPAAQVVDAAVVPDHPDNLRKIVIVLAGLLLAFPVALLIALITEAADVLRTLHRRAGSWTLALEQAWDGAAR